MNHISRVTIAFLLVTLAACGSGGGNDSSDSASTETSTVATAVGTFIDSPVEGVEFMSGSQVGVTDSNGQFTYEEGASVEFYIGDIVLGSATGKSQITPLDLADTTDINDTHVLNIARLLQSLDDDLTDDKISIPESVRSRAVKTDPSVGSFVSRINLADETTDIEEVANNFLADVTNSADYDSGRTLVSSSEAQNHLQNFLAVNNITFSTTFPASVARTGQTTPFTIPDANPYEDDDVETFDDDGALQIGVVWPVPRFVDNGDGTVTDDLTGLMWMKNADCFSVQSWAAALSIVETLNGTPSTCVDYTGAHTDWHLPDLNELASLIDFEQNEPVLPSGHLFTNMAEETNDYWSSSTSIEEVDKAWFVNFESGHINTYDKENHFHVWPVRVAP